MGVKGVKQNRRNAVLSGARFGKLTVIDRAGGSVRHPKFLVKCDCGREPYVVTGGALYNRGGCRFCARGGQPQKYGAPSHKIPLYITWTGMRHRCTRADLPDNAPWAGRGITICAEWSDFPTFKQWAETNGYRLGLSLDRIDVDGNYEPSNCQWVTRSENSKRARASYRSVRINRSEIDGRLAAGPQQTLMTIYG